MNRATPNANDCIFGAKSDFGHVRLRAMISRHVSNEARMGNHIVIFRVIFFSDVPLFQIENTT